jgi:hypothetical protein
LAFLPLSFVVVSMAMPTSRLVTPVGPRPPITAGLLVAVGGQWCSRITADGGYFGLLRSGPAALLNTGQQIGGALGLALLDPVAASIRTQVPHVGGEEPRRLIPIF